MINQTFTPFSGVGPTMDKRLKSFGLTHWEDILNKSISLPFSTEQNQELIGEAKRFIKAKETKDIYFLSNRFPNKEKWRILAEFLFDASYLDIETTGFDRRESTIVVIVCFHRGKLHTFVRGENLAQFLELLEDIKLLVSFNGSSFDIPFIQDYFKLSHLGFAHVDLRWVSYHMDIKGGLKEIETQLNVKRPKDLHGIDGFEAIMLWQEWIYSKNLQAKKKLIRYCQADVLSLILIAGSLLKKKNIPVRVPGIELYNTFLA